MYNREYWKKFLEDYGSEFDDKSGKKPLIYFDGYEEDNIDPMDWLTLKVELFEKSDHVRITVTYHADDKTLIEREIMLNFEDIEEVQTIKVLSVNE